jgi:hypothetical protein
MNVLGGGDSGNYIIKNEYGKDYFLKALLRSGLFDSCCASLIYNSSDLVCLEFKAYSVQQLDSFLTTINGINEKHDLIIHLLWCLNKQQSALKKLGYGIYNFNLRDIVVVNDHFFFLNNSDFIKEIKNHSLLFFSPLRLTLFNCPMLNRIRTLPAKSNVNCFNYSLGSLAFFILTDKKYEPEMNIAKELICIYKTKLYWTILRCLENKRLFYV